MKLLILRVFKWIVKRILLIANTNLLMKISNMLSKLNLWIESRLRRLDTDKQQKCYSINSVLRKYILKHDAPWHDVKISETKIPGMISEEEKNIIPGSANFTPGGGRL